MKSKYFCLLMMEIIAVVCFLAYKATNVQAAVQDEMVVYQLAGYGISSWVFIDDNSVKTGDKWDRIYLVNPKIEGEKVYIPEAQNKGNGPYNYFFIDQLKVYKGAIYQIKPGAKRMIDKITSVEPDQFIDLAAPDNDLIFNTFTQKNGMDRIYLDDPSQPSTLIRFYWRENVTLVRPAID